MKKVNTPEQTEQNELLSACRQYAEAKFKIRQLFPSLRTVDEIDRIVTTVISLGSQALAQTLSTKEKEATQKVTRSYVQVKAKPERPTALAAGSKESPAQGLREQMKLILHEVHGPLTVAGFIDAFDTAGWHIEATAKCSAKKRISNILTQNKRGDFVRHEGHRYGLATEDVAPTITANPVRQTSTVPSRKEEVLGAIERVYPTGTFTAAQVAEPLGLTGVDVKYALRELHQADIIRRVGQFVPSQWVLVAPSERKPRKRRHIRNDEDGGQRLLDAIKAVMGSKDMNRTQVYKALRAQGIIPLGSKNPQAYIGSLLLTKKTHFVPRAKRGFYAVRKVRA